MLTSLKVIRFHHFLILFLGFSLSPIYAQGSTGDLAGRDLAARNLPVIYFDLGDVLIDTRDKNNYRFMPGAEAYLRLVHGRGFVLGLITNIPADWGRTRAEKIRALKRFVTERWREPRPFPWQVFERIFVPPTDAYRKPHPYLFLEARKLPANCRPYFMGETIEEVLVARQTGFISYWTKTRGAPPFIPFHLLKCFSGAR